MLSNRERPSIPKTTHQGYVPEETSGFRKDQCYCALVDLSLQFDLNMAGNLAKNNLNPDVQLNSEQRCQILLEQFKTLREEIHIRIKQHIQLVLFKLGAIGAIIVYLTGSRIVPFPQFTEGSDTNINSILFWIIPFAAINFDFLISGNMRALYNIGPYIKKYIEPKFREEFKIDTHFWEESVASLTQKYYGYTKFDFFVIWTFTLVPTMGVFYIRKDEFSPLDQLFGLVAVVGNVAAIWTMVNAIVMPRNYRTPESQVDKTDIDS